MLLFSSISGLATLFLGLWVAIVAYRAFGKLLSKWADG
jgi:hypothetical protein